jgi:uncharacterized protein YndB with AHSA1/START domain
MSAPATDTGFGKAEVTIVRTIAAPCDLVFRMWTDPVHMAQWWGPHGFTNPVCEMDVRPGGKLRIVMRAPDGTDYPMTGEFKEVVPDERLVFVAVARDKDENPLLESLTEVTLASEGSGTRLTVEARAVGLVAIAPQMLAGMEAGWTQSLERLAALAVR